MHPPGAQAPNRPAGPQAAPLIRKKQAVVGLSRNSLIDCFDLGLRHLALCQYGFVFVIYGIMGFIGFLELWFLASDKFGIIGKTVFGQ